MLTRKLVLVVLTACALTASAQADDAFHHHSYAVGETVKFDFEDTDTIFLTTLKDGTIEAAASVKIQEIQIPVSIEVSSAGQNPIRRLTIAPAARYRTSSPEALSQTPFKLLSELDKKIPPAFSYLYKDDTDALNNLQKTFEAIRKGDAGSVGSFLFFKMEDVHQMQESVEKIPEGILPGTMHSSPGHEREGLGGKFVSAPSQLIYQGTENYNGIKAGYFKVISLGHQFSLPAMKTYTNFFFTMHVALEGPAKGLLLFGEGQETATVLKEKGIGGYEPQVILQRQFSIRQSNFTPAEPNTPSTALAANTAQPDFEEIFNGKKGCFILYDLKANKTIAEYNQTRCAERVYACSTFKVPIALMAFDQGILKDENAVVKWDGIRREYDDWNRDQTPKTWLKYSPVWVSQWITPQIGMERIKRYLADFRYGNQDMSGGITQAWLSSTLKISAEEQIEFLRRFWLGQTSVSVRAVDLVKKSMDLEQPNSGAVLRGKTGSGFLGDRNDANGLRVGWFVGHLLSDGREYIFATNYTGPAGSDPPGFTARTITKRILGEMKLF